MPQRIELDEKKARRTPSQELMTMLKLERIMKDAPLTDSERSRITNWFYSAFGPKFMAEEQPEVSLTGD